MPPPTEPRSVTPYLAGVLAAALRLAGRELPLLLSLLLVACGL